MSPLQGSLCEGVEDPAALATLEVDDRSAMATVNPEMVPLSTAWASQTIRMEQFDEFGVAGVLVQVIGQREVHGPNLRVNGSSPLRAPPFEAIVKRPSTGSPS
jgi:hypothetical protein